MECFPLSLALWQTGDVTIKENQTVKEYSVM